jgi:hypothetical protein
MLGAPVNRATRAVGWGFAVTAKAAVEETKIDQPWTVDLGKLIGPARPCPASFGSHAPRRSAVGRQVRRHSAAERPHLGEWKPNHPSVGTLVQRPRAQATSGDDKAKVTR